MSVDNGLTLCVTYSVSVDILTDLQPPPNY